MQWRPEELDQRVTFNAPSLVIDEGGGRTRTFVENFECWAKVKSLVGKENTNRDMIEATGNYLFVIRYREDFDESNQIIWGGDSYNIKFIAKESGRKLYLTINAERGVAQ